MCLLDFVIGGATFVGATDAETEGTWKWEDGEPFTYTNWAANEPNGNDTENCLEMDYYLQWNDIQCGGQDTNIHKFFVCETPISESCSEIIKIFFFINQFKSSF